ncbi:hypothetical protein GCM10022419_099760 [Nonomuraea rosea]|uniref:Uncharacterized protein n=1 Tax=Nonomuraea rosea TaxID=638574 RepID=A0ABP6ZC52_9ACTN
MSTGQQSQPIGTLKIRRAQKLAELSARLNADTAEPVTTIITRYAPEFLLQIQVGAPALAGVLKQWHAETPKKTKTAIAAQDAAAPPEVDRHASPGASYRAGDVVLCTGADGTLPASPQLAVFLSDVSSIQPEAPVIGRIEDLATLRRVAEVVATQPAADELLTTQVTTTLVVL